MNTVAVFLESYEFHRGRTLALLDQVEKLPDPIAALGFRPGPGRAHAAWQLMHIGVTEDSFATQRLAPHKTPRFGQLWNRFRGGSTPDDDIPSPEQIRQVLGESRAMLRETLSEIGDDRLDEIPPALAQRGLTMRQILSLLGWHEAHHQGQAHLTLNLFRATQGGGA